MSVEPEQSVDLRYNSKLRAKALESLAHALPKVATIRVTTTTDTTIVHNDALKLSAGARDASCLQSQLEPISTPTLRQRAESVFGIHFEQETGFDRKIVMERLLRAHEEQGPRKIVQYRGKVIEPQERLDQLHALLSNLEWPQNRERPKISAQRYMILQKPIPGASSSKRAEKERKKLVRYQTLWHAILKFLQDFTNPTFCNRFTAVAVTRNFTGSPHIDTLNVAPFYAVSLGDFSEGGGKIAVELDATTVAHVDTRSKLACIDGRHVHWVTPYSGDRYSLIFYVTYGPVAPRTSAVLPPTVPEETS